MPYKINRYPVTHPLLQRYINFFWELKIEQAELNHWLIPQRNVNMRFNLSDKPHYLRHGENETRLEDVYFPGLQSRFLNSSLKVSGKVDVMGICFTPDGFYPFLRIPGEELRNQVLGAEEIGLRVAGRISELLKEAPDTAARLVILERELLLLLSASCQPPEGFRQILEALKQPRNFSNINSFCRQYNISLRQVERLYNKYIGLSASAYCALNRFHLSLNQLLRTDYSKLSDLAFDNDFFDQTHFIKEFRRFTGVTPGRFARNGNSILQIGKFE
jgi:AraC-like DNA-binding protein